MAPRLLLISANTGTHLQRKAAMSESSTVNPQITYYLGAMLKYPLRWIVPALLIAGCAGAFAVLSTKSWEATQAIVVREEAIGNIDADGEFKDIDRMRSAQETVAAVLMSDAVISAALTEVGPPAIATRLTSYPAALDIEAARSTIAVKPPNGAEFGKTELFYLQVRSQGKDRTLELTRALCKHLDKQLQVLRTAKSESMVEELSRSVHLAEIELQRATGKLAAVEREVGSDLGELRILNESAAGDSNLRQTLIELDNELRAARTAQHARSRLLEMLLEARQQPDRLVAVPSDMLKSLPVLKQLKDGLTKAQLKTASLQAERTLQHPIVRAAIEEEKQIRRQLTLELPGSIQGLFADMEVGQTRVQTVGQQHAKVVARMTTLANLRARYGNLASEVKRREANLQTAQQKLGSAKASQDAARTSSIITFVDKPTAGAGPAGIGRAMILLAGIIGGLATGCGVLAVSIPPLPPGSAPGSAPVPVAPVTTAALPRRAPGSGNPWEPLPGEPSAPAGAAQHSVLSLREAIARRNGNRAV